MSPFTPMRLFLLLASLAIVGCQQVPVTGRSQFILVDEGEVAALSATEFAKMKKLPADPRLPKLREIGLKIVAAARRDDKAGVLPPASRWEFAVIDDKSPNAFAMPGGKIGFHTGMFAFAPTDDDLAVIMGHEVAHVICRHGSERVSQSMGVAIAAAREFACAIQDEHDEGRDCLICGGSAPVHSPECNIPEWSYRRADGSVR